MIAAVLAVEDSRISSMFVSFFIALLIVSPFGYRRIKATLAERRELLGRVDPDAGPTESGATTGADPDDLATVFDAIAVAASELSGEPDGHRVVDVPTSPTVEGRPADPALVDALLDDAVRRIGLVAERSTRPDGGRRLRLVRA